MKKNILNFGIAFLMVIVVSCGKKEEKKQDETKGDSIQKNTIENVEPKKEEPKKSQEPEKLSDYETKCDETNSISKLIFEGKEIDAKNITKAYAFNFGGTTQLVYLVNFEPDMKMLESGNIDNKKLQTGQVIVKLEFSRRNNKANKDLITVLAPYSRVIIPDANAESENKVLASIFIQGKSYGNKFLGSGMLSAVTTKIVCGKVEMKGENDDKYQLNCTFNTNNVLK
jgi:hypothetical protein